MDQARELALRSEENQLGHERFDCLPVVFTDFIRFPHLVAGWKTLCPSGLAKNSLSSGRPLSMSPHSHAQHLHSRGFASVSGRVQGHAAETLPHLLILCLDSGQLLHVRPVFHFLEHFPFSIFKIPDKTCWSIHITKAIVNLGAGSSLINKFCSLRLQGLPPMCLTMQFFSSLPLIRTCVIVDHQGDT